MELNKINSSMTNWGAEAANLNENFDKVSTAIEQVKNATIKSKGYFSSESALKLAIPTAAKGDKAYVGNNYPYQIWIWNGSSWGDSGSVGGEESVNLGNYHTKEYTDAKLSELGSKVLDINGSKDVSFDFGSTVRPAYANEHVEYAFKKGNTYKIEILNENSNVETYYSIRNSGSEVVMNQLCEGIGSREATFVAIQDAKYLYVSAKAESQSIFIAVKISNLSEGMAALENRIKETKGIADNNSDEVKKLNQDIIDARGFSPFTFDFTEGSVSAYAGRYVNCKFVAGETYRISVETDDDIETYFSMRDNEDNVISNNICRGVGIRSCEVVASKDAERLYMSLAVEGSPIIYHVVVSHLYRKNISTLSDNLDYVSINTLKYTTEIPSVEDFLPDKAISSTGGIVDSTGNSATEKYYTIFRGTTLRVRNYGSESLRGVVVYNNDTLTKEKEYPSNYIGDIFFDDDKKVRFCTNTKKISVFSAEAIPVSIYDITSKSSYVGRPVFDDFEIGNIAMSSTGWDYIDNVNRVRLKHGITYHFYVGDMIILEEGVRAYIGKREGEQYSVYAGWVTNKCTITSEGEYKLLFAYVSERKLTDKFELLAKIRILSNGGYYSNESLPHYPTSDDLPTIKVVNHRGFNTEAPENTESAYRLSKLRGFRYVETDVRFTSDNVPVILHDSTIDRTSNGSGTISQMTYDQASLYDYGSWFSDKYTGEPLLTFEKFMILCKTLGLLPYIELKDIPIGQEQTLIDIVAKYGMTKKVTWISFEYSILEKIKQILPYARLGYVGNLSETLISDAVGLKNETNQVFVDAQGSSLTLDLITSARANGLEVESWNPPNINSTVLTYLDGITTDSLQLWNFQGDVPVWNVLVSK